MLYQDNMQAMQEGKKILYSYLVKKEAIEEEGKLSVTSIPTKTDMMAIEIECEGMHIRLNSKYDPYQEAKKWAEQYRAKNLDTIVVMFGLGNGVFLRELVNQLEHYQYIIVYEPSYSIFSHTLENYELTDLFLNEKILIIVKGVNDYEYPYLISGLVTWMNLFSQVKCLHPGYDKLFPDAYRYFLDVLQDNQFTNLITKNTREKIGKYVAKNSITNMVYIKDSISFWDLQEQLPKDIPVVIISAGPSLNKNVEVLKQAKGKAIIMAVDKAYLTLLQHGIEPDFVVLLDVVKPLSSCGNKPGFTTPLLCLLEGSQQIMENHAGRKVVFQCSEYMTHYYEAYGKSMKDVKSGGSVSTSAFALCAVAGFKRIVLIGSNLAYDNGVSHAGGYADLYANEMELFVEDIEGKQVKTRYDWYSFLRWYENAILQMEDYDVINATEGGANIKGTRNMTLQEVVDQYCTKEIDCLSIINSMEPSFNAEAIGIIRARLTIAKQDLTEIQKKVNKVIADCQKLITDIKLNKNYTAESRRFLKLVTETNAFVEEKEITSVINQYILSIGVNEIEELYFMSTDKERDEILSYINTEKIYRNITKACDYIAPLIDQVLQTL